MRCILSVGGVVLALISQPGCAKGTPAKSPPRKAVPQSGMDQTGEGGQGSHDTEIPDNAVSSSASPYPIPLAEFPRRVAGFTFGQAPAEFVQVCTGAGGRASVTDDRLTIQCTKAAVDPFQLGQLVLATFCGEREALCRIMLVFHDRSRKTADQVRAELESKYGPMALRPTKAPCSPARVEDEVNGVWGWLEPLPDERFRVTGYIRLIYGCALGESYRKTFMFYEDEAGFLQGLQKDEERKENF